ncbi:MAG TPA: hypothetical protein VFL83_11760 [Anaeromyxobacter sp.]|nr:hypothetical protein [Anaeromyxobacter sp.]
MDELIEGLSAEAREAMRPLLRQAYDRGFREGLAGAGQAPVAVPQPAEQPAPPVAVSVAAPVAWILGSPPGANDAPDVEKEDEDDEEDAAEALPVRPILPLATIGTLRRRIVRTFDLERFDIDVVICRGGDPDRRQLRSTARLSLYRREEG